MALEGTRYDAHPFDLWSSRCPICGDSYDQHESSVLGSAVEPWEPFISAVQNGDWNAAVGLGRSDELIGRRDLVIAAALRCQENGKIAMMLYRSPYYPEHSHSLISQQILSERMTVALMSHLLLWRPVVQDRLRAIREMRAETR